jgi:ubiquinone/menaquinone biosynthesis C-methylase UbiE
MTDRTSRRRLIKQSVIGSALVSALNAPAQTLSAAPPAVSQQLIQNLIRAAGGTQMIYVAAKLRIADHLKDGPKTVSELAATTKTHEDTLYRLLRALASIGVFTEEEGLRFRLNAAAEVLRSGVPGSLQAAAEVAGQDWMWRPWGALLHSVQTGETAFDHLYGKGTFDWFAENPDAARLFDDFQAGMTARSAKAVVAAYDFSAARKVVDVGGGSGTLIAEILGRNASARGILFDLDHVVAAARTKLAPEIVHRCELTGGDFFKAIPAGGDIYLMKFILHDWNDARCQEILTTTRRAMSAKGRLLVIEDIVCGPNQPCVAKVGDILMLVRAGGRNRTEKEYRDLLSKGGFKTERVITTSAQSIVDAMPVG